MKKVLFFVTLAVMTASVFTGCKKDDKDVNVVGTWAYESAKEIIKMSGIPDAKMDITNSYYLGKTITFEDGKYTGLYGERGTYTIKGKKLTIVADGITENYSVAISDGKLITEETIDEMSIGPMKTKTTERTVYVKK